MTEKRRTLQILNSSVNWTFLVFIFLQVLFFTTYYFELPEKILNYYIQILHVLSWSIGILGVLIFLFSVFILFFGEKISVKMNVWNIIRSILAFSLVTITNTIEKIVVSSIYLKI